MDIKRKKQSVYDCGRLYLLKRELGQDISVKECVSLINGDLMVGQWGIQITLLQVQRSIQPRGLRSWPRITDCAEMFGLPKYTNFRRIKTKNDLLVQGSDATIKHKAHFSLADMGLILYKVAVLLMFRYLCISTP